jgi:hypothetical protein
MHILRIMILTLVLLTSVAHAQTFNRELRLTQPQVMAVQVCLRALGYDPGPVDGLAGYRTILAYNAWYTDNHVARYSAPAAGQLFAGQCEQAMTPAHAREQIGWPQMKLY